MNANSTNEWLTDNRIRWVKTEGVSIDGLVIGKYIGTKKFLDALPDGNAIADLVVGYDIGGTPYLAWWDEWRRDALGDIHQQPDLDTLVISSDRPSTANVLCDFTDLDGKPLPACARSTLKSVVQQLGDLGLVAQAAFEVEGMLFQPSPRSSRAAKYRGLAPMSHPVHLGYLHYNSRHMMAFMDILLERLDGLGIPVEGWHDEAGPGQFEINLDPADPVTACDYVVRLKQAAKETALDLGHTITFMAKPSEEYGNGLHVHHSLRRDGRPVFYATDGGELSETTRHWIGGMMATMPAATSLFAPNINSFRRMVEFAAAPTVASWAQDNKSTALRVLSRSPNSARIENRISGGDANPYLVLAGVLAGGIAGLQHHIEAPEALTVSGWGLPPGWPHLPNSITQAADAMSSDTLLHAVLGTSFCDYWVNTRRWEWLMYHTTGGDATASAVTQWELDRYFELV